MVMPPRRQSTIPQCKGSKQLSKRWLLNILPLRCKTTLALAVSKAEQALLLLGRQHARAQEPLDSVVATALEIVQQATLVLNLNVRLQNCLEQNN